MDETIDINNTLPFEGGNPSPSIIKVIGVGGGGGNAVNHMYKTGIEDVTFVLCNTDRQALANSDIPRKLQIGKGRGAGLGAGGIPPKGREAAEESIDEITELFNDGTQMAFITAGMGGGTGTGAAPIVAKVAKDLGILTVGIVTIPFIFEGRKKIQQAWVGVEEMRKNVDALLVNNNERLREIYPDLNFMNAFAKADDTLTIAAKSIAEIITIEGRINLDFADVKTTLKNGGVAIMSSGYGKGEKRVTKAIEDALNSPLLNDDNVFDAKRVLFNLYFSPEDQDQVKMEEMNEVNEFMSKFNDDVEVIWGAAFDNSLKDTMKITILATGFGSSALPGRPQYAEIENSWEIPSDEHPEEKNEQIPNNKENIIEQIYGQKAADEMKRTKARASFAILSIDQMDNDTILEMIDKSPTYNRTPQFKSQLEKAMENKAEEQESVISVQTSEKDNNPNGRILF